MIAKHFPVTHSRAGEETDFILKISQEEKIHTIRSNYELWKNRIDEINSGKAYLSVREWEDKPYRSKQIEVLKFYKLGIEKLELTKWGWLINDYEAQFFTSDFAVSDGLSREDFIEWFDGYENKPMAIIHFKDFRYDIIKTLIENN